MVGWSCWAPSPATRPIVPPFRTRYEAPQTGLSNLGQVRPFINWAAFNSHDTVLSVHCGAALAGVKESKPRLGLHAKLMQAEVRVGGSYGLSSRQSTTTSYESRLAHLSVIHTCLIFDKIFDRAEQIMPPCPVILTTTSNSGWYGNKAVVSKLYSCIASAQ